MLNSVKILAYLLGGINYRDIVGSLDDGTSVYMSLYLTSVPYIYNILRISFVIYLYNRFIIIIILNFK